MTSIANTQKAIKLVKTTFENILSENLNLMRVSAPMFLRTGTGVQDDLANTCASVKFNIPACGFDVEIVHSLAKWKRISLQHYEIPEHHGLYTDMNAIRKDEILDFMHSVYVDQWDWEMRITKDDRNENFLRETVIKIYNSIRHTEHVVNLFLRENNLATANNYLPDTITFVHSEELEEMFPELTPKERENEITKKYGAVFLIGIGYPLTSGFPHDVRAVDYDDWSTKNGNYHGLNGDIIVWNNVTECAFEISSMGIRVNSEALVEQSKISNSPINTKYHSMVLHDEIPLSIGGGIGQSRLCMFLLKKHHIGEVQVSEWSDEMITKLSKLGIYLL
jgi:aspartate--ammonia ligase